jgi:hypothetical protein
MKEEIKQLQEKARERFDKKYKKEFIIESEPENYIHIGLDSSQQLSHLLSDIDTLIEQIYKKAHKQGYFCGREDLKIEIIADFDKK